MASLRAVRRRVCSRKRRYPDAESAKSAAASMAHRKGAGFWAYRCTWCGSFHIGHSVAGIVNRASAEMSERSIETMADAGDSRG